MGMCFGVRDAVALAKEHAKNKPITILGELVHNETVLRDLRSHGVQFQSQLENVRTAEVMITAHGASDQLINKVRQQGHKVVEATCPLVHFAHRSLRKLVEEGYYPVVIGKRDHVEVRGLTEDFSECDVVLNAEEIGRIKERARFGVVSQTTQPVEKVLQLVGVLNNRFPNSEVRFIDTVCQPTKQRQSSVVALAKQCDVVVVVGGANSNNTRELVATSRLYCGRVHHVQTSADLREQWFNSAEIVGITAGTSTPDSMIEQVERAIVQISQPAVFA